ncbi:hypothetical protein [Pontitalea aquivivens]|uniref:hypothetical protein n=1 Tax=Pontitalea aquivivens TaxID=3388663 RepID=UPI003970E306
MTQPDAAHRTEGADRPGAVPDAPARGPGPARGPAGAGAAGAPRPRGRVGIWLLLSLPLIVAAMAFAVMALTHRPLPAPDWLITRLEARANAALAGRLSLRLAEGADLIIDEGFVPRLRFHGVVLMRPDGRPLAVLPELRSTLHAQPLLRGKIAPKSFRIRGASLSLRRLADGTLDLDLGGGAMALPRPESLAELSDLVERVFATPALAALERIEVQEVALRLDDRRLARVWQVSQGQMMLTQTDQDISVTLGLDVGAHDESPARVSLSASTRKGSAEASFGAAVTGVKARDLAVQSPALAWLGVLEAPISGAIRSGIDAAGRVARLDAMLEIGAGALSPVQGARPLAFDGGKVYLGYDPVSRRVTFTDLSVQSRALRLRATGHADLKDFAAGLPGTLLAQVAISDLQLDPEGLFEQPARFTRGALDLRLRLQPFAIDLGQLQLIEGDRQISAKGRVGADAAGWRVALDMGVNRIGQADLLALWPPALVPRTRVWVADNVATGQLHNVQAALRLAPGAEPRLALGYEFQGAEVRVLRTLPPVQDGRGFATIRDTTHALLVERGHVIAPAGGRVDVTDTVMTVPDIRIKPAPARVRLVTRSSIPAALSLLDQPPFEFLTRAGQPTDIAQGMAHAVTDLDFVLKPRVPPDEVGYAVTARLTDVRSDKIVPGRLLEAETLSLRADRAGGLVLSGRGRLSGVPFDVAWRQQFGPEHRGISSVEGQIGISPAALDAFGIGLPKGALTGTGQGRIALDLRRGEPTRFRLQSDLRGLALAIPQIGWSKGAASAGQLDLSGRLGAPPAVEALRLEAPGLAAEGSISLRAGGGLDLARFGAVTIGRWFSGAAELRGQGAGQAADVFVTSGRVDLRRAPFGAGGGGGGDGGGGGGGGAGGAVRVALDRLTVSDSIALTGFRGDFGTRGGFQGRFAGRVNGAAPVEGTLTPGPGGRAAVSLSAPDAGATLAAAGIFARAGGGSLDLRLTPVGDPGSYDGVAVMRDLRVRDAPVLASMLSAASVIGLLEQLNGEGILFSDVEGAFRLTPQGVTLTRGEAVGASLGVTMTGRYIPGQGTGGGQIDMAGVVSPFYLLNSIGQILTRRGEGLFGFTYTMAGPTVAPRVTINPLSILTPGMFREIFRRPPPKVAQ